MSDVPIGSLPDPDPSSVSGSRSEVMGVLGQAASSVGKVVGGAVAGIGSARSSVADVLGGASEGVKALGKEVDTFVNRHGKKFEDTLTRVAAVLKDAQQASVGLGEALGTAGSSMMGWSGEARESAEKAHKASRPGESTHQVQEAFGRFSKGVGTTSSTPNGGVGAGSGVPGSGHTIVYADSVEVRGPGGGGDGAGGGGRGGGNAGDKPNGGFLSQTAKFGGLLTLGAGIRAAGNLYGTERQQLRPQQTAFQRAGFGSIPRQQALMREYHASGVSEFSAEDLTGALNIGTSYLGGTNFRPASLAPMQIASPDMSATQAAQVAQAAGEPGFRTRLYQYGINTKGMGPDERLMAAARFALQKRQGAALTAEDYNKMSTQGETAFSNLQHLFGGDQAAMQAARDLVGQEAGITGLDTANATLRSEVSRDRAQRVMANETLEEMAGVAEEQNKWLERIYGGIARLPSEFQSAVAGLGAVAGPAQGLLGAAGGSLFTGASTALGWHGVKRALGGGTAGGTAGAGSKVGGALSRLAAPLAGAAALFEGGRRLVDNDVLRPGRFSESMGNRRASATHFIDMFKSLPFDVGFGEHKVSSGLQSLVDTFLPEDEGDPPDGSNIRTSKPVEHVTGLQPRLRNALEQMFRDNPRLRLNSGYRSIEHQKRLWKDALKKYGDPEIADNWVARPGKSNHNRGVAADIGPRSEYDWIKRNAARYGLEVPMSHEPWHVEPVGARSGKEKVDTNIASGGLASRGDSAGQPKAEERGFAGVMFNLGGVTSSEGDIFAALIGGGNAGPPPSAGASPSQGRDAAVLGGADRGMLNSAGAAGTGTFSGTFAQRARAIARVAKQAGFRGNDLTTAVAIALGESSGDPTAHNPDASTGDNSYGLWQINMLGRMGPARRKKYGLSSNAELFNPSVNARAAYDLFRQRGGFGDWSVYNRGDHQQYLDEAQAGVAAVGDPPTPGEGVDGAPRGGSVVMRGGNKTVQMQIFGQQDPVGLAREVMRILHDEEEFEMVGAS